MHRNFEKKNEQCKITLSKPREPKKVRRYHNFFGHQIPKVSAHLVLFLVCLTFKETPDFWSNIKIRGLPVLPSREQRKNARICAKKETGAYSPGFSRESVGRRKSQFVMRGETMATSSSPPFFKQKNLRRRIDGVSSLTQCDNRRKGRSTDFSPFFGDRQLPHCQKREFS